MAQFAVDGAQFAVDGGQLALYLVFTLASLLASSLAYCLHQHLFPQALPDYHEHIRFFARVSRLGGQPERARVEAP